MNYQKLFNHLRDEHGLILVESELMEIVNAMQEDCKDVCPCCGSSNTYRTLAIHCTNCAVNTELDCL